MMTLASEASVTPGVHVLKQELVAKLHQRVGAARRDRRLPERARSGVCAIAQHVIPEHLDTLRRES